MTRRRALGLWVLAGAGALAGCTRAPDPTAHSVTTNGVPPTTLTRTHEPVPAIVHGPGAVDVGVKWNTHLTPPLTYAAALGSGVTFTEVEWCAVRDLPGEERFAASDRALAQASGFGFQMMIKLRVGNCSGTPAPIDPEDGTPKQPSTAPDDPGRYRDWVTAMVRRYLPRGVRTWAVENEVDAANFWSGTPQEYADTVHLVAAAIRAVDPGAVVLDAGISSTGYGVAIAGELLDAGRAEEALAAYTAYFARRHEGGVSRFPQVTSVAGLRDVLADPRVVRVREMVAATWAVVNGGAVGAYQLHFYEDPAVLPQVLRYVDSHLAAPIPVSAWEIGTAWPGPSYDEDRHARDVVRLVGTLLARRVCPVVYLPLAFTPRPGKAPVFRGLVSPDGRTLPAGAAFARIAAAAKASSAVLPVMVGTGGRGSILVGTTTSLGLLWDADGEPRLLDLPGGRDAALLAASDSLGMTVSLAG
jgi:hypothetical protein